MWLLTWTIIIKISRWPCELRRMSAAAWMLGSRVSNALRPWLCVSRVCCVLCRKRPLRRPDYSFRGVLPCVCVCLIVCDLETSNTRRPRPELGCGATGEKKNRKWLDSKCFKLTILSLKNIGQVTNLDDVTMLQNWEVVLKSLSLKRIHK